MIGDELFADGGLFANSPDLIALHEAEHFFKKRIDEFLCSASAPPRRSFPFRTRSDATLVSHSGRDGFRKSFSQLSNLRSNTSFDTSSVIVMYVGAEAGTATPGESEFDLMFRYRANTEIAAELTDSGN